MNLDSFLRALATAFAIEVLPVPGGPYNSSTNPLFFKFAFFIWLIAIISIILSLTFYKPYIS
jgi:hypothetical protein